MFKLITDVEYVTSWDLKQYTYCPMIPWLRANYLVEEPPSKSMELGSLSIEEKEVVANELELPKPIRYEVYVVSRKLRAVGIVDIIAGSRRLVVVEVKKYCRRYFKHFETQLKFYTLLVTKEEGPVTTAILKLGSKILKYRVEYEDLRRLEHLINKVREVKESPSPPAVNPIANQCINCWYRRYCIKAAL